MGIKEQMEAKGWGDVKYFEEEGRYSGEATHNNNNLELSIWFEGEEITGTNHFFSTEMEYGSIPTPQLCWEDTWTDDSEFGKEL